VLQRALLGDTCTGWTLAVTRGARSATVGYLFAFAGRPAYLNARGYWEFAAEHRVEDGALIATLSFPLGPSPKK
jgi:hypothetical protein